MRKLPSRSCLAYEYNSAGLHHRAEAALQVKSTLMWAACAQGRGQCLDALRVSILNIPPLPCSFIFGVFVMNSKQQLEEDMPSFQGLWEMNAFMT